MGSPTSRVWPGSSHRRARVGAAAVLYALIARLLVPAAWWGRLRVVGLEAMPADGPVLLVPNHDSQWDPLLVGVALRRVRPLRFLARASLWRIPGLGPVLHGLGQIPIERGSGDVGAIRAAVEALGAGAAVCVFPEGRLSRGEALRARTGVSRLWAECPQARVVLCAIAGTPGYVRFPRRPRVGVELFEPAGGQPAIDEDPQLLATRLLTELRERVPPTAVGRRLPWLAR
jgi:1-acyl-sn-glycerol-3-phosphate acyltransferase